jgi:hypothetical protein
MKSENLASGRVSKVTSGWFAGVNSVRNSWQLPENQCKWGVNIQLRGGLAQTRPGFDMQLSLPSGNFQGGVFFAANKQESSSKTEIINGKKVTTPAKIFNADGVGVFKDEIPYILFAVNGSLYYSPFPLQQPKNWEDYKLSGIELDQNVDQFVFALATKTANLSTGKNEIVTPSHRIVVIQDGISSPAYWDGSNKTGVQSESIPIGYWMAFSGNRLWIADKNIVLASDLGDPTSWEERQAGEGRGDFLFSRPVTGMVNYVGQDTSTRLVVFTDRQTFSLSSGILDRSQWAITQNFQSTLYPTVGCIAGKSIAFQGGQMWWYSQGGLVAADVAAASYLSSQVLYKDVEMARTKKYFAGDITKICAVAFENYLLYSVPYFEKLNSQTMVLDYAPASEWSQNKIPAWYGVWTGIRPVEWTTGTVDGQQRCFGFSIDYAATSDGSYNHLWEAFSPNKYDTFFDVLSDGSTQKSYARIYCQFETARLGDLMDLKQFIFAEIEAMEVGGITDVSVSFRGSKGKYKNVLKKRLLAVTDEFQYQNTPEQEKIGNAAILNSQYRRIVTETAQRTADYETCESDFTIDIDKAFSILIEWCGQLGVEVVRVFMDPYPERSLGFPKRDETKYCVVGQNGENFTVNSLPDRYAVRADQNTWYAQVSRTVSLPCIGGGQTIAATATASYLSYISYEHAEDQASVLAQQEAIAAAQKFRAENPCPP